MSFRSSIISWRDVCTQVVATYFAELESTLPTTAVNDGRPSEPGAGCITSAPYYARFSRSTVTNERGIAHTHDNGWIEWISENGCRNCIGDKIDTAKFYVYPVNASEQISYRLPKWRLLQTYIRPVLRLCIITLSRLQALRRDSHLIKVSIKLNFSSQT